MVIEAGLHLAHFLAEAQHHAELVRLDPEEAGGTPQRQRRDRQQREAAAAETAARQEAPQFILAAAQHFFEIGGRRSRLLRAGAPGALTSRRRRPTGRPRRPDCSMA